MWATASDVLGRWVGDPPAVEDSTISLLIEDAEEFIRGEYPSIQDLIDDGTVAEANVMRVVVQMVTRKMQNPLGIRQQNETTGPFSSGVTYAGDIPGDLWTLTDAQRVMLGDTTVGGNGKAFTIRTGPF